MSIHVALNHVTEYRYDRRVHLSPQVVRLRPAPHCRTPIHAYSLRVTPTPHFVSWQQDPQSNHVARFVFPEQVQELRLETDVVAEMAVYNPFDFFLEPRAEQFPFGYDARETRELQPFLARECETPLFARYLGGVDRRPRRTVDFLVELNGRLQRDLGYVIRLEPGVQSKEETLRAGRGSCRDTSWLLVQLLRHLGLAARFVSGYLVQLRPDLREEGAAPGPEEDFTDLHAWCEAYLPGAGWVGLDPTSGLLAGEGHIPLACAPEPESAAPLTGSVDECTVELHHSLTVRRLRETPRTTAPYTEEAWGRIHALGRAVDESLAHHDVRLTMGGEPTFVSMDDREGEEWNTAALGPRKKALAARLLFRLKRRYAPQGVVHFGQGKWYPGDVLPRWSLGCYWRRDGEPVWCDPGLFADEEASYGYGPPEAEAFARRLCENLGISPDYLETAYEDVLYYLWRERRLPANVDPLDARLEDPSDRERLRRVFTQGLGSVAGYALPLAAAALPAAGPASSRFRTGPWFLRSEHMYLLPGDSPMGYRLPLDSLPWATPEDQRPFLDRDPFEPRAPLAPRATLASSAPRFQRALGVEEDAPLFAKEASPFESADWIVRTALCVEPRRGVLHVFLPPLRDLEDYLALVAALETTAGELGTPVVLEGYPPPADPRLRGFQVTPDPGVIEVNVQESGSWDELVELTSTLYEEARQSRLTPEKFLLDGRQVGTGGGSHVVLGGPRPEDSPFLRRPDLLRSLLSYWHNHPSLSYLFSGLFIGPTSQAPRVDEARHESLYELEVAFAATPGADSPAPPWLVDRLYRHLLVDATGNTHRAEFCIDKLFSPDHASGRRGLLEMRAFEMPPHPRLGLVTQLLLRTLVERFWREPYGTRLVRWGPELHDRFLLPHFVRQDFEDVLEELVRAGYPFERDWFAPHFEFRFPVYGEIATRGVRLELRQALEPWPVLGEEGGAAGTARFVDSSVERLQVLAAGLNHDRHVIACNGRALPLHPTGRNGEAVAGVRFRAWRPPSCLHPTIPVHTPLTFDIVDTWMERSLGGGQYHAMHPGGRHYDTLPVNAQEAESRRLSRFFPLGHTPGRLRPGLPRPTREAPLTLDLRAR